MNGIIKRRDTYGSGLDPDAQAFLIATAITDATITIAINQLVIDLKGADLWDKMKAIYPFVGGTSTTHKYNLKDPRDLDVAFRLGFVGGWTHDINGVQPNGSTGYANTFLNPFTEIAQFKICSGMYVRQATAAGTTFAYGAGYNSTYLAQVNGNNFFWNIYPDPYISYSGSLTRLIMMRRESSTLLQGYRDGVSNGTQTGTATTQNPNSNIFYGALNNNGASGFDSTPSSLFFVGEDFTNQNSIDFNTAINTFQTTLGRNV